MSKKTASGERIAKVMARVGLCSRRDAERWIAAGRVHVNGVLLDSPACVVGAHDRIEVDGKPLANAEGTRLFLYHKPVGLVTSHKDEQGRQTVFETLPKYLPRLISVGRLDLNTEGLLLLTNDGELSRKLEHPDTGWARTYRVRVRGDVRTGALASLKHGVTIDGIHYGTVEATLEHKSEGQNHWISMTIYEGKNREIRKICTHLGLAVNRLIRTHYGPYQLADLPVGQVIEVPKENLPCV